MTHDGCFIFIKVLCMKEQQSYIIKLSYGKCTNVLVTDNSSTLHQFQYTVQHVQIYYDVFDKSSPYCKLMYKPLIKILWRICFSISKIVKLQQNNEMYR